MHVVELIKAVCLNQLNQTKFIAIVEKCHSRVKEDCL